MSRPLRIEYPGAWYHIMNRGRRGEDIFKEKEDRITFLTLLKESAKLWNVHISAYFLMNNHYHILAQTPQANLSRFMRHLNGVYTQRFNRFHGYDGQLFRGRYKSILVEEDSYLLELVRYIHRNPLRAEIIDNLANYAWSSHHGYLSTTKKWTWLYKNHIFSMLNADINNRRKAYLQFMGQNESDELLTIFEKKKWPSLLGSNDFISWVKETYFEKKIHRQIPESIQLAPAISMIIEEVCQGYKVKAKDLLIGQRGKSNEPRNVAIYLGRVLRNDTMMELGKTFGMSGYSPASSAVERVKKNLQVNRKLQKKIEEIKQSLLAKQRPK
ncbi:MAG: transposase [Desulfobulbaceae bacterium]|nr:transposase [Desulfobulbaceae bacterium]